MTLVQRLGLSIVLLLVAVASPVIGLAQEAEETSFNYTSFNETCPVTEGEPVDKSISAEYKGRTVYFCCQRCRRTFLKDPESYEARLAAITTIEKSPDPDHAQGTDHDHAQVADHDHAKDHGESDGSLSTSERLIRFAGKFHPVIVHFPIGMLTFSFFFFLLSLVTKKREFFVTSRYLVLFGAPMTVLAALLGWAAYAHAVYSGALHQTLERHQWMGTITAVLSLVALLFVERYWRSPTPKRQRIALVSLVAIAGLVGLTGHLGGTLIFGLEHYTW